MVDPITIGSDSDVDSTYAYLGGSSLYFDVYSIGDAANDTVPSWWRDVYLERPQLLAGHNSCCSFNGRHLRAGGISLFGVDVWGALPGENARCGVPAGVPRRLEPATITRPRKKNE